MGKEIFGEIVSVHKTGYYVRVDGSLTQEFGLIPVNMESRPVVNDRVLLEQREDRLFVKEILERKNYVARFDPYKERYQGFASNIDTVFIVTSANKEFSANRILRFLTLLGIDSDNHDELTSGAPFGGENIKKVVILTKCDLVGNNEKEGFEKKIDDLGRGLRRVSINSLDIDDVANLTKFIKKNGTVLLMGSSGVGKSTVINTLLGLDLKTREVQEDRLGNKGKHTTSARTMYYMKCGRKIIDTPGIKIIGIEGETFVKR